MKVDVYQNLNEDCISVRSRESEDYGRVVAHKPRITVVDAEFVVQESGRQRCIEEGQRNVHAFVRGKWDDSVKVLDGTKISYNPYKNEHFVDPMRRPVAGAEAVNVTTSGAFGRNITYLTNEELKW